MVTNVFSVHCLIVCSTFSPDCQAKIVLLGMAKAYTAVSRKVNTFIEMLFS